MNTQPEVLETKTAIEKLTDKQRSELVSKEVQRVIGTAENFTFIERKEYDVCGHRVYWVYGFTTPGLAAGLKQAATLDSDGAIDLRFHRIFLK